MEELKEIDNPSSLHVDPANLYDGNVYFVHYFGKPIEQKFSLMNLDKSIVYELMEENNDWQLLSRKSNAPLGYDFFEKNSGIKTLDDLTEFNIDTKKGEISLIFYNPSIGIVKIICSAIIERKGAAMHVSALDNEHTREFFKYLKENKIVEPAKDKPTIGIIKKEPNGEYKLNNFDIDYHDIDFDRYYEKSEKLKSMHEEIITNVNERDENQSFYILHGTWGTGKTSYIKYLMNFLKKRVIYIPPHMVDVLADPSFVDFMGENTNSVLVIEDAEDVVEPQGGKRTNALANLLGMTDGILGSCFKMDVICTFNTRISKIDSALMRKGRLNGVYKFVELSHNKAKNLCDELGVDVPEEGKRTLANIFNAEEELYDDDLELEGVGYNMSKNGKDN